MKIKPIPTSPKEKINNQNNIESLYQDKNLRIINKPEKKYKISILVVILIAILFGFFAGLLGNIFINYYASDLPFIKELGILSFINPSSVVFRKTGTNESSNNQDFSKIVEKANQTQVSIFSEKSGADLSAVYLPSEQKGFGVAVSSDGIFVTAHKAVDDLQKNYVAITSDKKIYKMLDLARDQVTSAVFFRIEVNNFPINQFAVDQNLENGQTVILTFSQLGQGNNLKLLQITNKSARNIQTKDDLVDSSEVLNRNILISENQEGYLSGTPILNTGGEIIGLMAESNIVKPINAIKLALDSLLASQKIKRPYLGIRYIDLSEAINLPASLTQNKKQGALIYSEDKEKPAIIPKSPAQKAGLKEKDIIVKVDDYIIDQSTNLTEIIQNYKPSSMLDIVVLRNKKEQTIKLELEEIK